MLLLGCEEEILQKLRGAEFLAAAEVYVVGNVRYDVYDLLVFIKLQTFLREVAELHGFAYIEASRIRLHQSEKHLYEGGLACTVVAHDAHLLESGEVIIEILEYDLRRHSFLLEGLANILALEDFASYVNL